MPLAQFSLSPTLTPTDAFVLLNFVTFPSNRSFIHFVPCLCTLSSFGRTAQCPVKQLFQHCLPFFLP